MRDAQSRGTTGVSSQHQATRGGDGGAHLGLDVVKGWRADNGEANEEDICLRVRERSQSVVILLTRSVPESEADWLAIDHYTRRVVIEAGMGMSEVWLVVIRWVKDGLMGRDGRGGSIHGRNVLSGKGIGCV